jgi:hypothetical protein
MPQFRIPAHKDKVGNARCQRRREVNRVVCAKRVPFRQVSRQCGHLRMELDNVKTFDKRLEAVP